MDIKTHTEPVTSSNNIRSMMGATAEMVIEKARESRNGFVTVIHGGEKILGQVKEKAVENVKATDTTLRNHPYEALAIALGVGVLIGYSYHRFSQIHKIGIATR